jgi:uncharacterized protein YndB with AHSA1/START domain
MRIVAERELLASPEAAWALLAEPYHLSDWWPGYTAIRPDRRGFEEGARWTVVRNDDPGFLRKPRSEAVVVIGPIHRGQGFAWRDPEQGFTVEVWLHPEGRNSRAEVVLEAPWWRIPVEGLRYLPRSAVSRLHNLCQSAASL